MSESKVEVIMGRIKTATERSPIAVFKGSRPEFLNAVFGDTSETQMWIKSRSDLVGVYHNQMDQMAVHHELLQAAGVRQ